MTVSLRSAQILPPNRATRIEILADLENRAARNGPSTGPSVTWHNVRSAIARSADGMPRIKDIPGPYWFFFYSFDCNEPVHVHVRRENKMCKFWLDPIHLAANHGFSGRELNEIRDYVETYQKQFIEAWHEHCGQHRGPDTED